MKKLISILLIFATTTIACMSTAMASFVVWDSEISANMMQQEMKMTSNDCCDRVQEKDCTSNNHECCISPFSDSSIIWNINTTTSVKKEITKWKILDFSFLAILQEKLDNNYWNVLNSPPLEEDSSELTNPYITLIGIVKSNC